MLVSKKHYIEDMLDRLVSGWKYTGIRDIVDISIEQYIDTHTTAVANNWDESTAENIKNNILARHLEETLLESFGKDLIKYIHLTNQYKNMLISKNNTENEKQSK